jgi:NAD(P)-dependent dehydrogenase (short-subunit alcohol dehydrogenase family)
MAEAGADIVVAARQQAKIEAAVAEIAARGGKAAGVSVDVSDPAQIQRIVDTAMDAFGKVDILVNNAGSSWGATFKRGLLLELDASDFDGAFSTNVRSQLLVAKSVVPIMQAQETGGCIINMSSVAGQLNLVPSPTMGLYSATKAAILSFTRSMAAEWAPKVRVNALMPGLIQTDRTRNDPNRKATDEELAVNIAMGRVGVPADVAGAAVFLASDAAAWITGASIQIDGGPKPRLM